MDLNKELGDVRQLLDDIKARGETPQNTEVTKHLQDLEQEVTQMFAKLGPLMSRNAPTESEADIAAAAEQAAAAPAVAAQKAKAAAPEKAGAAGKIGVGVKAGKVAKPIEKDDLKMLTQFFKEHALPRAQLAALVQSLLHEKKEASPQPHVTTTVDEGEAWQDWDDFKEL